MDGNLSRWIVITIIACFFDLLAAGVENYEAYLARYSPVPTWTRRVILAAKVHWPGYRLLHSHILLLSHGHLSTPSEHDPGLALKIAYPTAPAKLEHEQANQPRKQIPRNHENTPSRCISISIRLVSFLLRFGTHTRSRWFNVSGRSWGNMCYLLEWLKHAILKSTK